MSSLRPGQNLATDGFFAHNNLFEVDNLFDKLDQAALSVVFAPVPLDASQSSVAIDLAACSNAPCVPYDFINRACGR